MSTNELFQKALMEYSGTVLIVSHDRYFLDNLVKRVIEIRNGKIYEYLGNYSYYYEKRQMQLENNHNDSPISDEDKPLNYKSRDKKRIEAEERNRLSRLKKEIQNRIQPVEETISELEKRKNENETLLCDPLVLKDSEKVKSLLKELGEIKENLTHLMTEWETLAEEMDKLGSME